MTSQHLIGNVSAEKLAEEYGTPLYVYDKQTIVDRFTSLKKAMKYPKTKIYYSCKANTNPDVIKVLKEVGVCGVETVSLGEAKICLEAGFKPEEINLTSTSFSREELKEIDDLGITLVVDSLSQLQKYKEISGKDSFWLRVNSGYGVGYHEYINVGRKDSKFGIYPNEFEEVKKLGKIKGMHKHSGCGVLEVSEFLKTLPNFYEIVKSFPDIEKVNIGGGLGIPYAPEDKHLDIVEFGEKVSENFAEFCKEYGRELELRLEPGRYFVGEAGMVVARVNTIKKSPNRKYAILDVGFSQFIRPLLYDAYHEIVNASNPNGKLEKVWIAGNVCEACDLFTGEREIPEIREGDILIIKNAGAYGYVMASEYQSRPKPKEVLVDGEEHRLI